MFKIKIRKGPAAIDGDDVAQVASQAERFYRAGNMHCAEAVLASLKNRYAPGMSDDVLRLAAGFGGGSGAGCICGALAGGTMAFGLILAGDKKGVAAMTVELHAWFKKEYGASCCRILTAKGKKCCVNFTASVAGKAALLLQENGSSHSLRPCEAATPPNT